MNIGDKIKQKRKEAEMTQVELSSKSLIPLSSIKQYESGARNPKFETLTKIAEALGVNIYELIEMKEFEEPKEAPQENTQSYNGKSCNQHQPSAKVISKLAKILDVLPNQVVDTIVPPDCVNIFNDDALIKILTSVNIDNEIRKYINEIMDVDYLENLFTSHNLSSDEKNTISANYCGPDHGKYINKEILSSFKNLCHFHNVNILNSDEYKILKLIDSNTFKAFLIGIIESSKEGE